MTGQVESVEVEHTVTAADTASSLGSGTVRVLGTPRLLAWFEAATVAESSRLLADGETTVGTAVELRHRRPSPVGSTVRVHVEVTAHDGRRIEFRVAARSAEGDLLATGTVRRAVVEEATFAR